MPSVSIIMGSSSDWPKIKNCALILKEFGVEFDVRVFSAHRTPKALEAFVKSAPERGVKVILAAAGGAAHLAGVIASMTVLPVIGIPVETNLCGGLDSMLSMIQMPGDIPVATVGVGSGGAKNAGILAVEILALSNPELLEKLNQYRVKIAEKVNAMDEKLQETIKEELG